MTKADSWDSIMSVVELPNQILLGTLGSRDARYSAIKPSQRFFLDLNKSENNITFKERPSPQDKTWDYLPVLTLPNNVVVAYLCSSGELDKDKAAICFFQVFETVNLFMIAEVSLSDRFRVRQIIPLKDGNILVFVQSLFDNNPGDATNTYGKIIDINTKRIKSEFVVSCLVEALEIRPGVLALLKDSNYLFPSWSPLELAFWSLKKNKIMHKLSLPRTDDVFDQKIENMHELSLSLARRSSSNDSHQRICALDVSTLLVSWGYTLYLINCPGKSNNGVFPKQKGSGITKKDCCAIF